MSRRALVVCTANVCRSPVVAKLLQRALDEQPSSGAWVVTSAGTADVCADADPYTVAAAKAVGIDLVRHRRRTLSKQILDTDGRDLVLTMTREQLRYAVALDHTAWPRTFTLKQLARVAAQSAPDAAGDTFTSWLRSCGGGRRPAEMVNPDPLDDIDDPSGAPRQEHDAMIAEAASLVATLARVAPWGH
jgi:protein-tyrosine phosphatase